MNIVLCDDEKLFLSSVRQKIELWAQKSGHLNSIIFHSFSSSEDLLDAWEHGMQVDALFLDIQIPGEISGLAAAREIRNTNEYLPIVFITGYGQYAEEGYSVNALRFLHKPVTDEAIYACMNLIWRQWTLLNGDCIVLDLPTQILRLPVHSVLYAEVSGHTCFLQTSDREEPYQFRQTMQYLRNKLSSDLFIQCHRSYIINMMYVRHITGRSIMMADGEEIQIGRKYQASFMSAFRWLYLKEGGSIS